MQVGKSGDPAICADALMAELAPCGVDVTPAAARGPVQVELPLPTAVGAFTASPSVITCGGDAAAQPPISVATNASLAIELLFSDGQQRPVLDARVTLTLDSASDPGCSLAHDADSRSASVAAAGAPCAAARCIVNAAFPTLNASLTAQAVISVVAVEEVTLYSQAYSEPAACDAAVLAAAPVPPVLRPLSCSLTDYQQVTLCAIAQLSAAEGEAAGRTTDVSAAATFSSADVSVLLLPNLINATVANRVRPTSASSTTLTATFAGVPSSALALTASAAAAAVHVAAFSLSWVPTVQADCGVQCSQTFAALANATQALQLSVELSDGYSYASGTLLGAANAANDLLNVSSVFTFSSSELDAIAVDDAGEAQLLGNSAGAVSLQVSSSCTADGRTLSETVQVYANVQPAQLDVDIGQPYGPPLQAADMAAAPGELQVRLA